MLKEHQFGIVVWNVHMAELYIQICLYKASLDGNMGRTAYGPSGLGAVAPFIDLLHLYTVS